RYPASLSGAQRQRVGLARALAADPPLLLMDEPFGAIDPIVRARLQDELLRLQGEVRKTIVFVTHDVDEAIKLGDRIAILRQGGVLAQYDTPQTILAQPADDFVAEFVGADRALKALALRALWGDTLQPALVQHIELTLIAVGIGFVLAFLLALVGYGFRHLDPPIGVLADFLYTIPSLALFQLLVPITGLTVTTVEVALVSYTLLILYRNMLAGLRNVPPDTLEAARGMGLTRRQLFLPVQL